MNYDNLEEALGASFTTAMVMADVVEMAAAALMQLR